MATTPTNWLADAATQYRQENGPAAIGANVRPTGLACPKCFEAGNSKVPLLQNISDRSIACANNHKWKDMADKNVDDGTAITALEQVMALNPERIPIPQRVTQQVNHVPLTFKLHKDLKEALEKRFAGRLEPTLGAMCTLLLDPVAFVVDSINAERINALAGMKIRDGAGLYGILLSQAQEIQQFKETEAQRKREAILRGDAVPASTDDIVLRLPTDIRAQLQAKAEAQERPMTIAQYLENQMKWFLDNGWL